MGTTPASSGVRARWTVALIQLGALAVAAVLIVATVSWDRWDLVSLFTILVFVVVSDLTYIESNSLKIKINGVAMGAVLAAVLLGGAPAAIVGVAAIAVGWLRSREAGHYFVNNLIVYLCFPLAAAAFFGGVVRLADISNAQPAYYLLVLPAFGIALAVNFLGVIGYQCYLDHSSFIQKARESVLPLLSADLFSAALTAVAVYFVVKAGTVGVVVLAVTLLIFQYLVGELLRSQTRARELHRRATTDELTGLENRASFRMEIERRISSPESAGEPFAVMLLDLDRFKEINDTLGHHYGDILLRGLGARIAECVGEGGVVARLGGDEFAVLPAVDVVDPERLGEVARSLISCAERPLEIDQMSLEVGASVGIVRYPVDGTDVHTLLRRADIAMYEAKKHHGSYEMYAAAVDHHSLRKLTVLPDLRRALEAQEFVLHYQPIVIADEATVYGAEALIRWQHPELGLISPATFIPAAEESGLIGRLTRYVLDAAISQCAEWHRGGRALKVAVNLSVRDLLDRSLAAHTEHLLSAYRLPADALELEITESMIVSDPDRVRDTLRSLCDLGVRVAVDDFGTGYSSLANLRRLPINDLKIDRSFVSSLLRDESDLIIVRSTINLGHDLGMTVIAEGVEDELTLKRLRTLGCNLVQGYYLGRPVPAGEFSQWLGTDAASTARALMA